MGRVIALIPARANSRGIPGKNFKPLAGRSPMNRAIDVAKACGRQGLIDQFYVTSDIDWAANEMFRSEKPIYRIGEWIHRPAELAQDDTSMFDVVKHALEQIPGEPDDIIVLLQPTQPLREPKHVQAAIQMLRESWVGTVVSVVTTETVDKLLTLEGEELQPVSAIERRQDGRPTFRRDGTVYAWYRGNGYLPRPWWPLMIPVSESCALDTPEDWAEAERRLKERELAAV